MQKKVISSFWTQLHAQYERCAHFCHWVTVFFSVFFLKPVGCCITLKVSFFFFMKKKNRNGIVWQWLALEPLGVKVPGSVPGLVVGSFHVGFLLSALISSDSPKARTIGILVTLNLLHTVWLWVSLVGPSQKARGDNKIKSHSYIFKVHSFIQR